MARDDGFTLIELLFVVALMALVLVVVVSRVASGPTETHVRATAKQVAAGLRSARGEAIRLNREAVFVLDLEQRAYRVDARTPVGLAPGVVLSLYTATSELIDADAGRIRFFPDGSSTGGRIGIKRPDDQSTPTTVSVDWLTGRVVVSD